MLRRHRLLIANTVLALALAAACWGRRVESAAVTNPAFLSGLSLPFRGWAVEQGVLSAGDAALLQPDGVLMRTYRSREGESAQLTVVAGHRKRTVHTPGYCMVGGGWEVVSQDGRELRVAGQSIPAVRTVMTNGRAHLVVTYFFTDGVFSTRNVVELQAVSLLKRFRADVPLSALVRIVVPVTTDLGAAERLSDEFAAATVAPVLEALRGARLRVG